jgi:hypothetical protein
LIARESPPDLGLWPARVRQINAGDELSGSAEIRNIWYQIDAGDADPATFFYDLGLAAPRRRRETESLWRQPRIG